jgi:hypothetical protein
VEAYRQLACALIDIHEVFFMSRADKRHRACKRNLICAVFFYVVQAQVPQLLRVHAEPRVSNDEWDELITSVISYSHSVQRTETAMGLVGTLHSVDRRIHAYLACDMLKSAYMLAIRTPNAADHVKAIHECAAQANNVAIIALCESYFDELNQTL